MSSRPSLEIIDQPIDQLRGCENSAHTHNRAQYAKVSALIKKHGPVIPLIVDPDGEVIDGFLRLQCLKDQGYKTVPTVTVRTNNPADIKTLRLALNRPIGCGRLPQ
jgi:ParB-like chromosome segregation protein Spo0J